MVAAVRCRNYLLGTAMVVPVAVVAVLACLPRRMRDGHVNPSFQYGDGQAVAALVVIVASLAVTVTTLSLAHRYRNRNHEERDRVGARDGEAENLLDNDEREDGPQTDE